MIQTRSEEWTQAIDEAARIVRSYCDKCGGTGRVRGRKLDCPAPSIASDELYPCDSEICRIADKVIAKLGNER